MIEIWNKINWFNLPAPIKDYFANIIKSTKFTNEVVSSVKSFEFTNQRLNCNVIETFKVEIEFQSLEQLSFETYKLLKLEDKNESKTS